MDSGHLFLCWCGYWWNREKRGWTAQRERWERIQISSSLQAFLFPLSVSSFILPSLTLWFLKCRWMKDVYHLSLYHSLTILPHFSIIQSGMVKEYGKALIPLSPSHHSLTNEGRMKGWVLEAFFLYPFHVMPDRPPFNHSILFLRKSLTEKRAGGKDMETGDTERRDPHSLLRSSLVIPCPFPWLVSKLRNRSKM